MRAAAKVRGIAIRQETSSPSGCWPGSRTVLGSSPSPQSVEVGNRLNRGWIGGQPTELVADLNSRDSAFARAEQQMTKHCPGRFVRRILGMGSFDGLFRFDHLLR